jgi:hypothetical protein
LLARAGFRVERLESPGPSYPFGMAVLAQRLPSGVADWDRDLPDRPSQQAAVTAFRAHAALIGAYHAALRSFVAPLLERVRANGARLAVYGTGVFFDQMFLHTSLQPSDIALVVDDNDEKWGTRTRQGLAIESPQRITESGIDIVLTGTDTFEAPVAAKAEALAANSRVAFELVRPHSGALAGLAAMKVQ